MAFFVGAATLLIYALVKVVRFLGGCYLVTYWKLLGELI
jgi:hypothetical protein